jgi:predicted RNA binding protein YcfA (HicA-like mRNA interferase family)
MGIKQIPTTKFIKFLKGQGLSYIRSKGDHDQYDRLDKPLLRPVTVVSTLKDVPLTHIHTSLKNLGMSKADYEKIIKKL